MGSGMNEEYEGGHGTEMGSRSRTEGAESLCKVYI